MLLCVADNARAQDGSVATDRAALVALYDATDGANWRNDTNWSSDEPLSSWHGVTTDENGRVTELDLSKNRLHGTIPAALGNLARLERLDLGNAFNLQEILFPRNHLTGSIPATLGRLAALRVLDLQRNDLSGAIPAELENLAGLEDMLLIYNRRLTGSLPVGLRRLSRLDRLWTLSTDLCAPRDIAFQAWLSTIDFSGVNCPSASQSVIDVAVFHTPAARDALHGTALLEAEIDLWIAATNRAYVESGVNQRLSLVATEEVEYTETGTIQTDWDRLRHASDGYMDAIHHTRDKVAADVVVLVVDSLQNACGGGAGRMPLVSTVYEINAFAVIDIDARCGALAFAHELGHVMGLAHDRYVACDEHGCDRVAYPYSYGYVNQRAFDDGAPASARWRTVMAYDTQCSRSGFRCESLLRFSNPDQIYLGDPMGVAGVEASTAATGPADAARTLNRTRETVANFRRVLPVTVSFGAAAYTAAEGGDAATVTVRLSAAPGRPVAIPLTTMGVGGATGDDYSGVPSTVAFAADETETTFDVSAFDDTDDDDGEQVEIGFGALLPSGVTAGNPRAATVTIADNDGAPEAPVANRSPEAVGTLSALTLQIADGSSTLDVSGAFRDLDGDALTYGASSSSPSVATVSVSSSTVTLTPLTAGVSTVTVTATDAAGSNTSATQQFVVTVELGGTVDYDADDDGLIEIATLWQLDAVRHDLDGDGAPAETGATAYGAAYPDAVAGMGCPAAGCAGYELIADLDFDTDGSGSADAGDAYWNAGAGWAPLGSGGAAFATTFEGNGHTVAHLFINRGADAGLFGVSTSAIRHAGVVDASVTGTSRVGGLVGQNIGTIHGSYATGSVSGGTSVGGLVGLNVFGGVTASYATAAVSGETSVGGLVGGNFGIVSASYATGGVTGSGQVGGLAGQHFGVVIASYATGRVSADTEVGGLAGGVGGRVTASYWDTETSGWTGVGAGVGQSTSALQGPTAYAGLYAGWDVDVDGDGAADAPWHFGTAGQYPALAVDFDGDGRATWQEFGRQLREGPAVKASSPASGTPVEVSWTAVDTSHWMPPPAVSYAVYRRSGDSEALVASAVDGLSYTDTGAAAGVEYRYQVAVELSGGEASRSGAVGPNRRPEAVGGLSAVTLQIADGASTVDVSAAFRDADDDDLTYGVVSSAPAVATVSMSSSVVTLTPLTAGVSTVTVTATDVAGSNTSARQQFVVTVANRPPEKVGTLSDRTLQIADGAVTLDVSGGFRDLDGDALTYGAASSSPAVATVSVSSSTLTLTPLSAGVSTVTVTATDVAGSNRSASQQFVVTVAGGAAVDYDADDDGLIEIATLARLDAVRHDLDGDGAPIEAGATAYGAAYPDAVAGMGCPAAGCTGYELVADLDFDTDGSGSPDAGDAYWNAGAGWAPLGSGGAAFATTFEGNGHTIAHLFINRGADAGLFGGSTGAIRHVGVVDAAVTGASRVGALVGQNIGAIVGSYVTGSVSGGTNVGGLVGFNLFGGVYASYATAVVSGATSVGGLVGGNFGIVTASYATGGVTGSGQVGGLAGQHVGVVAVSYATGRVLGDTEVGGLAGAGGGRVTASYWDQETSGWTGAGAGSGQSTSALYGPTGYADLYAGWNVDVDSDGAADAPWHLGTAGQYPALVVDFDGDGQSTWQEFGRQLRDGPAVEASSPASGTPVEVRWTAAETSHWTPSPAVSYAVYRRSGDTEALVASAVEGLSYTDTGAAAGVEYRYQVAVELSGGEASRSGAVAPNRWPEAVGGLSAVTLQIAAGAVAVDVSGAFRDLDGDALTYGVVSSAPAVATVSMSSSVVTLTPLSAGVSTVTVTATDAGGANRSATQQFVVTVANRSPEAVGTLSDRTLQIADGAVTVDVSGAFRDLDGDALTYGAASSTPAVATVSVSNSTLTLTPLSAGVSTVTMTATDVAGSNTSATQQFVVTVANRSPEAVGTLSAATLQIADGTSTVDVSGAFRDLDGDALTYGAASSSPAVATVSVSASTLTLTPLSAGVSTVTVTATDVAGSNTSASQQFVVTVANRAPEPVGTLSDRTLEIVDGAVTVDVSGAFRDLDGDALTYGAASSSPTVATASVSSSTVMLTALSAGVSTVTVTATDAAGSNTSASQQFEVTVEAGGPFDYDADDDGLIEIATLAQLDAVRHDLDGDGAPTETGATAYAAAFPDPISGMGCPATGCAGYELVADLDFDTDGSGSADAGDAYWNAGAGWVPLGSAAAAFATTFEGNGHTLAHLFINRGADAGLFGGTASSSAIRHVGVVDAAVTGASRVGALVGQNIGAIRGSYATGSVSGGTNVGGLVGFNVFGGVYASYATAVVSGATSVGGLVGFNFGMVTASYATGGVTGSGKVGGLAGQHLGLVGASYATGRVSGDTEVGGLTGVGGGRVTASYWDQETSGWTGAGSGSGQSTSALQGPTGYAGLYAGWDVDVDGDGAADAPWDFGTSSEYPALSVDANGDGAATWRELGLQGRPAASATSGVSRGAGVRSWGASFTDDPLRPGVTPVRAVHLLELRARVDGLRRRAGLGAFGWTDPTITPGVTPARAVHVTELRKALAAAYAAAGRPAPGYTDPMVTVGATVLRAAHLTELRAAVVALERAPASRTDR